MRYAYVTVNMENNPAGSAEAPRNAYRDVIDEQAEQGARYAGWLPVKSGPTGKLLALELVFEWDE